VLLSTGPWIPRRGSGVRQLVTRRGIGQHAGRRQFEVESEHGRPNRWQCSMCADSRVWSGVVAVPDTAALTRHRPALPGLRHAQPRGAHLTGAHRGRWFPAGMSHQLTQDQHIDPGCRQFRTVGAPQPVRSDPKGTPSMSGSGEQERSPTSVTGSPVLGPRKTTKQAALASPGGPSSCRWAPSTANNATSTGTARSRPSCRPPAADPLATLNHPAAEGHYSHGGDTWHLTRIP